MMKSIKRMVLTGAAVMVMMSFALQAMAAINPNGLYTDYGDSSLAPSAYDALSNYSDIGTAGDGIPPEAGGSNGTGYQNPDIYKVCPYGFEWVCKWYGK